MLLDPRVDFSGARRAVEGLYPHRKIVDFALEGGESLFASADINSQTGRKQASWYSKPSPKEDYSFGMFNASLLGEGEYAFNHENSAKRMKLHSSFSESLTDQFDDMMTAVANHNRFRSGPLQRNGQIYENAVVGTSSDHHVSTTPGE